MGRLALLGCGSSNLGLATGLGQRALIGVGGINVDLTTGTKYFPVGSALSAAGAPQAIASTKWRGAGKFSKLNAAAVTNSRTSASQVEVLINGVVALTVTIGANDFTNRTDATEVDVADGDDVVVRVVLATGTGNLRLRGISWQFKTAAGVQVFNHINSYFIGSTGTAKTHTPIGLGLTGQEIPALEAATLSHMVGAFGGENNAGGYGVGSVVNTDTAAAALLSWKNGAAGAQALSWAVGEAIGQKEDTVGGHIDTISPTGNGGSPDTWGIRAPVRATTAQQFNRVGIKYTGAVPGRTIIGGAPSGNNMAAGGVFYGGPYSTAGLAVNGASQTNCEMVIPFAARFSHLSAICPLFNGADPAVIEVLKNGASTGYTITFSATGTVIDTSGGSVTFAAGDRIGWKTTGHTGGTIAVIWIGGLLTDLNAV